MRKVSRNAVQDFWQCKPARHSNTWIVQEGDWTVMLLHGNAIARRRGLRLEVSSAGWTTSTTRERLNGVLSEVNAHAWIKDGVLYAAGPGLDCEGPVELDRTWTAVKFGTPAEQLVYATRKTEP
jgi:hypothetical protein